MKESTDIENQELDELFEKYRQAPDSYVFVVLADACRKIGRIEEAMDICISGVAKHPTYASGYVVKGKCLYDLKRYDEARDSFKEVLALDASNLVALKFLGKLEADMERYVEAREYFQNILALDPDNEEIKKTLLDVDEQEQMARSADASAKPPTADAVVAKGAQSIETSEELATITLAEIFANQGYKDKAKKIYQEILKKQPDNAVVYEKLRELGGDPVAKPEPHQAPPDSTSAHVEHEIIDTGAGGADSGAAAVDDMEPVQEDGAPDVPAMETETLSAVDEDRPNSAGMAATPGVMVDPPSIDDALSAAEEPPLTDDTPRAAVEPPSVDDALRAAEEPPLVDDPLSAAEEPSLADDSTGVAAEPPMTDDTLGVTVEPPVTDGAAGVTFEMPPLADEIPPTTVDPPVTDDAAGVTFEMPPSTEETTEEAATKGVADGSAEPASGPATDSTASGDVAGPAEATDRAEESRPAEQADGPAPERADRKRQRTGGKDGQYDVPPLVIRLGMEEGARRKKAAAKGKKKDAEDDIPDSLDARRNRRQIDEKESLSHFKRWLNRLND